MGQYHRTVNLDKKESLDPHKLGDGLKLLEQCGYSPGGINDALHLLLAISSGRGGGDFQSDSPLIGSWGGDRIAVVGDYAEDSDLADVNAKQVYDDASYNTNGWKDITDELIPILEREYELVYVGDGWRSRVSFGDIVGCVSSYGNGDRTIEFKSPTTGALHEFKSSEVATAIRKHYDPHKELTLSSLHLV